MMSNKNVEAKHIIWMNKTKRNEMTTTTFLMFGSVSLDTKVTKRKTKIKARKISKNVSIIISCFSISLPQQFGWWICGSQREKADQKINVNHHQSKVRWQFSLLLWRNLSFCCRIIFLWFFHHHGWLLLIDCNQCLVHFEPFRMCFDYCSLIVASLGHQSSSDQRQSEIHCLLLYFISSVIKVLCAMRNWNWRRKQEMTTREISWNSQIVTAIEQMRARIEFWHCIKIQKFVRIVGYYGFIDFPTSFDVAAPSILSISQCSFEFDSFLSPFISSLEFVML